MSVHSTPSKASTAARLGCAAVSALLFVGLAGLPAQAVGEGPNYNGNETINTSILHTYDSMVAELKKQDAKQPAMELETIGQSVRGRDLFVAKYLSSPDNPTIAFLTQQHGNEQLTTEGTLEVIKHLGTGRMKGILENVNILFIPMLNPDGAMGDVDANLDHYIASGDRHLTRANANGADINRDHVSKLQPEIQALHNNVLSKYDIDYMIDLHHQGTRSAINGDLVSGSILYPTTPDVAPEVLEGSKRLGSIVYQNVDGTGWGHLGKYNGGDARTIARNGIAAEYGISTLLFEMRGMSDHSNPGSILGQKSNGYLRQQTILTLESTIKAMADGSIETADTSFWDSLPVQSTLRAEEEATE